MPLDPQAEALLKKLADSGAQPFETMTLAEGHSIVSLLENRTWTEDRIQRTPAIAGAHLQLWVT